MYLKPLLQWAGILAPFLLLPANSELVGGPGLRGILEEDEIDGDHRELIFLKKLKFVKEDPNFKLERCRGDCDDDDQCKGKLVCFNPADSDDGLVPGCQGQVSVY